MPRFLVALVLLVWPATACAGQLTLTWTDNATEEQGFRVERCKVIAPAVDCHAFAQVGSVAALPGTGDVQWTQTGLTVGVTFCYRVRAYGAAGNSGYSNEACGTVPELSIPAAPTNLSIQ